MSGLIIFISHMLRVGVYIWIQQIYLDLIPDHRRNGFYSFVPTIVIFAQAPFTIGSGNLIESEGYLLLTIILGIVTLFSSFLYYLAMRSVKEELHLSDTSWFIFLHENWLRNTKYSISVWLCNFFLCVYHWYLMYIFF